MWRREKEKEEHIEKISQRKKGKMEGKRIKPWQSKNQYEL
jgi:hypothetical protein